MVLIQQRNIPRKGGDYRDNIPGRVFPPKYGQEATFVIFLLYQNFIRLRSFFVRFVAKKRERVAIFCLDLRLFVGQDEKLTNTKPV